MDFHRFYFVLLCIFVFHLANNVDQCLGSNSCDWFQGSWVYDKSLPQYDNKTCPFIKKSMNCRGNGRPDTEYQTYAWKPTGCNLTRFDGQDFVNRFKGKHIMFVGDSLSQNQFGSLTCLLYSAIPGLKYKFHQLGEIRTFRLIDYHINISMDLNHFFVDIKTTPDGRMLDLDSIEDGKNWLGVDTLVFNTWHWWFTKKPFTPWDYVKDGAKTSKDIDRIYAMKRALATWRKWVDNNIDTKNTRVFFQGMSPTHYHGNDWGQPKASCLNQKTPILGSKYPGPDPSKDIDIQKSALKTMKVPVTLLDITNLSLFRKDGHQSHYGKNATGTDCTHWCISGVPDTWNQIFYNFIISTEILHTSFTETKFSPIQ